MDFRGVAMSAVVVIFLSETVAVWALLERGDFQFLQIMLFSQAWIAVVALPFFLRTEIQIAAAKRKILSALVFVLSLCVLLGAWVQVRSSTASNYLEAGKTMVSGFSELFFILGVVTAAGSLLATSILRAEK
jgi:hypothetical protein